MQCGFIKLHRQILDWEWYDDPNTMRLFLHCLLRANHKDNNWRGILIKRGSFLTSLETLSKETKLSISQVRTAIRKLETTSELTSLSQARSRVITIVNYDMYQAGDKVNSKVNDKLVTSSSQASDKLVTTNKNDKNDKKEKNDNKKKRTAFKKPSLEDINNFANDNKLNVIGFYDYYESNGWKVGKNKMIDWKAAARGWSSRQGNFNKQQAKVDINNIQNQNYRNGRF